MPTSSLARSSFLGTLILGKAVGDWFRRGGLWHDCSRLECREIDSIQSLEELPSIEKGCPEEPIRGICLFHMIKGFHAGAEGSRASHARARKEGILCGRAWSWQAAYEDVGGQVMAGLALSCRLRGTVLVIVPSVCISVSHVMRTMSCRCLNGTPAPRQRICRDYFGSCVSSCRTQSYQQDLLYLCLFMLDCLHNGADQPCSYYIPSKGLYRMRLSVPTSRAVPTTSQY